MTDITNLDNRIFLLQQTKNKPSEIADLVYQADVAFLQDRDAEAEDLVSLAEDRCRQLGIRIAEPSCLGLVLKEG